MSHTRLSRQLQFFIRVIRQAAQEGISPQAWLARHPRPTSTGGEGLSRRSFLSVLGAAPVAATALQLVERFGIPAVGGALAPSLAGCEPTPSPTPEPTPNPTTVPVVIVGAGMAGINACHRLAQAGVRAEVYESRTRVGGRMYSGVGLFAQDLGSGGAYMVTELGGEFVNSIDVELLSLVSELKLSLIDLTEHYDLDDVFYFQGRRVTMVELLPELRMLTDAADADIAKFGGTVSYQDTVGASKLDAMSVREWINGVGVSALTSAYACACVAADYGGEVDEMSAISAIYFFTSTGYPYDEKYGIQGGNEQVPRLLGEKYPDQLHLSHQLTALARDPEGWRLTFVKLDEAGNPTSEQVEVVAGHVIMTLPFSTLRLVSLPSDLPEVKRRCIDTLGYGTNAKRVLPVSERFWLDQNQNGYIVTDQPFGMGWDSCVGQAGGVGTWSNFLSGSEGVALASGTLAEQHAQLLDELRPIWPAVDTYARGEGARQCWPADPFVRGSYACYLKGQYTGIGGAEVEPVDSLFFAGEHTSVEFQGYMNGAAQTGRDAAEAVLATLRGQPLPAVKPHACLRRPRIQLEGAQKATAATGQ